MKKILIACLLLCLVYSGFSQSLTDGEYMVKIGQTGQYIAIAAAAHVNGARAVQWEKEYSSHFLFIITHLGNDVYSIMAKHSGKYLSTEGDAKAGAKLIQWDWLNQDNQKWYILPHPGGKGFVMNSFTEKFPVVIQYWNSLVTPRKGAYLYLQGDPNFRPMLLDFKKNEVE
ncbi:MAG: hypothetical protein EOO09_00395 [Chitinophagaceae bacterium]|nr:MAG: hypothetical protein EOO09_00395 [Chitinophagaceae bacterium]